MKPLTYLLFLFTIAPVLGLAQNGTLKGRVYDALNNEPLPFAVVVVDGTQYSGTTDLDGNYVIDGVPAGLYNITCQLLGYRTSTIYEIQIRPSKPAQVDFAMEQQTQELNEVTVTAADQFEKKAESPVSVNVIGINEIQRNPGGNQDISRVIQSLPGVATGVAFRNDIIVRGGGPNENKFYLDGIEIPAINHFATQGSSGGPVGMINVNFIREVDFYTGAFPSNRGNTLSSLMEIKLKDGRSDKIGGIFQIGASDVGLTLEGPLGKKTTFLASARRSYLQFLFSALDLPFLPTYNDFQFKTKTVFNKHHQLTVLGLGAIDNFELNTAANETPEQRYILNYLPVNEQWNYSIGAKYTWFAAESYTDVVLSRFMLNNSAFKYQNNDENQEQLLDYTSQEIENKLRLEHHRKWGGIRINFGGGFEQAKYNTLTDDKRFANGFVLNYSSDLMVYKWALFGQASRSFMDNRIDLSLGLRADAMDFSPTTSNLLNQFSPRVAFSFNFSDELSFNANWGIYYQLPPYTTLGFRDQVTGELVNTEVGYIQNTQYVAGFAYIFPFSGRLSLEGFYKDYQNYPFLLNDSINLANLGGDFGVIGNAPAESTGKGRAYGVELSYQQKLYKGFFGVAAFTYVRSEFTDKNGEYIPSSWDNRFFASITGGKKFGKNWEVGIQYQFLGGAPYTPYDVVATANIQNWDNIGFGIPDYDRLNSQRLESFNRVNIRVDKKWYFERFSLDVYIDIQNLLGDEVAGQPFLDVQRDSNGDPVVDPNDPSQYLLTSLPNQTGTTLPTIGLIFEF
ncbi:MAG: TonB-dependent receptor [Bacteroidota bacterium]|nr:TonB-dependent receptor [Bacteroidota bacterium]